MKTEKHGLGRDLRRPGSIVGKALTGLAMASALAATGCGETSAAELTTGQIVMNVYANVYDDGTGDVWVSLRESFDDVVLADGEALWLHVDEDLPLLMAPRSTFGGYDAPLRADGRAIRVEYDRPTKTSAPNTIFAMPEPLVFATPLAGRQVSYADGDFEVTVENPEDDARLFYWTRSCGTTSGSIDTSGVDKFDDEGSLTIEMSRLLDAPPPAGGTCITVDITREIAGIPTGPALHPNGEIQVERSEAFDVMVMP